jgi:adenylate cyclase
MSHPSSETAAPSDYRIEIEPSDRNVKVVFAGVTVADSDRALVLVETRLPPAYYLPREDVRMDLLERTDYRTHCPFKGDASYWTLRVGERHADNAVWSYEDPDPEVALLRDYVAFYRTRMDSWYEGGAEVSIRPLTDRHQHGNPLVDWLLRDAWEAQGTGELVARLGRQLRVSGIPVTRMNLLVRTLHPQVMGIVYLWSHPEDGVQKIELSHASGEEERFLSSPMVPIFEGRGGVRRRLEGDDRVLDFPILQDLHEQGATDYAAMPLTFSDGQIHAITFATDVPGGFGTENMGHVHEILPLVSRLVEVHSMRRTARTLLDTYLGVHTGERVLEGSIRRGDGELIPAVIWWADLRGSTQLAEELPRQRYLDLLNRFFESTAGAAIDHGGEVLKFIGDAVLAIFPVKDQPDAGTRALAAARDAQGQLERWNAHSEGGPEIGMALALHVGEVTYGNIGIEGRLDFTVTGPAVNAVARLEHVAKVLDKPIVASGDFAKLAPDESVSLGLHELRGVREPVEVFTLRELV